MKHSGYWRPIRVVRKDKHYQKVWLCECTKCGTHHEVFQNTLRNGTSTMCFDCSREEIKTHGLGSHPLAPRYRAMLARCYNTKNHAYERYGGRGIKVCSRWKGTNGLKHFIEDMWPLPFPKASLDRIDVNKGYSKSNCRWVRPELQARNKRNNISPGMNLRYFYDAFQRV